MKPQLEKRLVDGVSVVPCQGRTCLEKEANACGILREALSESKRMVLESLRCNLY